MARLQSSTGELLESRWIWSMRIYQGIVSSQDQEDDKSMCLQSAMCTGTSLSSRAMCAKTEMRRAARISPNGYEICTRLHVNITDKVRPANCQYLTLTFHVEGLLTLSCLLLEESKFLLHITAQTETEPDTPKLSDEREMLIFPNLMKRRSHNRRSQSDTACEMLTAASTDTVL